eukprot:scaffold2638_cov114-Cylindrotheca_fusiformis.AAC.14
MMQFQFVQSKDAAADAKLLSEDEELVEALEIFQRMSPEEMEETVLELMKQMDDDPDGRAELESLLNDILPELKLQQQQDQDQQQQQQNLKQMIEEDEIAVATQDALRLLSGSSWEDLWAKQDIVLEGVLNSGQLTPEDAALFKSDKAAWKEQLKFIWDELQKQAAAAASEL